MVTAVTVILVDEVEPHVWMFESNALAARFLHAALEIEGVFIVKIHENQVLDPSQTDDALADLRGLTQEVSA